MQAQERHQTILVGSLEAEVWAEPVAEGLVQSQAQALLPRTGLALGTISRLLSNRGIFIAYLVKGYTYVSTKQQVLDILACDYKRCNVATFLTADKCNFGFVHDLLKSVLASHDRLSNRFKNLSLVSKEAASERAAGRSSLYMVACICGLTPGGPDCTDVGVSRFGALRCNRNVIRQGWCP